MIPFGNRIEMMVDNYLIESMKNISFRKNEPVCIHKAIEYKGEWENAGSLGVSVLDNGVNVMLYYRGFPGLSAKDEDETQTACLAISTDGINFTPAAVNAIEYNGKKENNIVLMNSCCHNFAMYPRITCGRITAYTFILCQNTASFPFMLMKTVEKPLPRNFYLPVTTCI